VYVYVCVCECACAHLSLNPFADLTVYSCLVYWSHNLLLNMVMAGKSIIFFLKLFCFDVEERVNEITREYYDDLITDGLNPDRETGAVLYYSCSSVSPIL